MERGETQSIEEGLRKIIGEIDKAIELHTRGDDSAWQALQQILVQASQKFQEYLPFIHADELERQFPQLQATRKGRKALLIRLPEDTLNEIDTLADQHLLTRATVIEKLIDRGLEEGKGGKIEWE